MSGLKCPECDDELTLVCMGREKADYFVGSGGEIDWDSGESIEGAPGELGMLLHCYNCGAEYSVSVVNKEENDIAEIGEKYEQSMYTIMIDLLDRAKKYLPNSSDFYIHCIKKFLLDEGYLPYNSIENMKKSLEDRIKEYSRRDM